MSAILAVNKGCCLTWVFNMAAELVQLSPYLANSASCFGSLKSIPGMPSGGSFLPIIYSLKSGEPSSSSCGGFFSSVCRHHSFRGRNGRHAKGIKQCIGKCCTRRKCSKSNLIGKRGQPVSLNVPDAHIATANSPSRVFI